MEAHCEMKVESIAGERALTQQMLKKAEVANVFAHLIPNPPSFTGRVACIHSVML